MKKTAISLLLTFAALLGGCGDTTETPLVKEVEDIQISETNASLYATTNKLELHAKVNYDDGSSEDVTQACGWESDDYTKLSISYGKIIPKANGDDNGSSAFVLISAHYKGLSDSTTVELVPLKQLTIVDTNDTNHSGYTDTVYTFSAIATYEDNKTLPIDENNSENIKWVVDGNAISVVVEDGVLKVVFGTGESNITVSAFGDINQTFTIDITDADTSNSN